MAVMVGRADNRKAADLFYDLALAMELQGERWRANSYLKAARSIEELTENLRSVSERGELRRIEGVGESIEAKVEEFLRTGHIEALDSVRGLLPEDLELLRAYPAGTRRLPTSTSPWASARPMNSCALPMRDDYERLSSARR